MFMLAALNVLRLQMVLQHSIPSIGDDGYGVHNHDSNEVSPPCLLNFDYAYTQQINRLKVGVQPL